MSGKYPGFSRELSAMGYTVINSETVESFIPYERDHADMQCLIIDDTAFVLSRCHRLADELSERYDVIRCGDTVSGKYPHNVALNAAVVGKYLIAKLDSLDKRIIEYAKVRKYVLINVRQGYAKCSCAIVSDNALITADKGIYDSLKETNIDVLLIEAGNIRLVGADYGFIGGASGLDTSSGRRRSFFTGNIFSHPDSDKIVSFCDKHDTEIVVLDKDSELTDIGGMIFC